MTNKPIYIHTMILKKLRLWLVAIIASVAIFFHVNTQNSLAADIQIDASVTFLESVSLIVEELEFGVFSFSTDAGANDITISADSGAVTCSNTTEYTCPASGNAGKLGINGTSGNLVNISCDNAAIMSNGVRAFDVEDVKINVSGSEFNCSGFGNSAASLTLAGDAQQNLVKIGAKLIIPSSGLSSAESGEYSTANTGGDSIAVQVLYQ